MRLNFAECFLPLSSGNFILKIYTFANSEGRTALQYVRSASLCK